MEIGTEKEPTAKKIYSSNLMHFPVLVHGQLISAFMKVESVLTNILYTVSEYILEEKSFILLICHLCV